MRLLLSIIFVLVPSFASKERVPLQNLPEDEKNILFELVKRLGKSSEYDVGWRDNSQSLNPSLRCAVSTNMSSIIKRVDSENNGAKFLTLHEDIETNEACSDLCCKNKSCDLAVYENKGDHHCYLFQCEGKCLFGHHSSYISNSIVRRAQQPPAVAADGSELDLMDLDEDSDTGRSNKDNSVNPTTTTPVPTTPAPTPAPYIRAHSVGLEGPHCERDLHCEDPNAVCNFHKCRCQEGYYQKGHICRKNCAPSNFGCLELGTLGRGPQCVSMSQVCDSVMQCADGSDEFNCPDTGSLPISTWQQQQQQQQQQPQIPAAQKPQQQQQQQQPLLSPQQQQSYPEGFRGYSEQGMVAPNRDQGRGGGAGSFQAFPEDQTYSQAADAGYGGYNQQPAQPQQPYLFPSPDQLQRGSMQSPPNGYPAGPSAKYDSAAQYPGKGAQDGLSKASSQSAQQQLPASSGQTQGDKGVQGYQKPAPSQGHPPVSPHQAVPRPVPQAEHSQQALPHQPHPVHQNLPPQQGDLNPQPQTLPDKEGSQQPFPQGQQPPTASASVAQQPFQQAASAQSYPGQPQHYRPAAPQQGPVSGGKAGKKQAQQTPVSQTKASSKSDTSAAYGPVEAQPGKSKVTGGGGMEQHQSAGSATHDRPAPKHDASPKNGPHAGSNPQRVPPHVLNPAHPTKLGKSDLAASDSRGGHPSAKLSPALTEGQKKPYAAAGPSQAQSEADSAYSLPRPNAKPQPLHPHSPYDVRVGDPSMARHQPGVGQQSFLNPSELNNLDPQGSSQFLDSFGNQYLSGQGYGQPYNQYGRYPSAYSQNTGSKANGFGGLPDQLYAGSQGQGQRVYPQQGYLDLGYQSPQYEFGEFDPAYSETDSFPGSHDLPSYRPGSKLGYADSPYKTPGLTNKNGKLTEQGDDSRRLGGNAEGKPDMPSKADSEAPEHDGDISSKDKDKSQAQEASPSSQTQDSSDNNNKKPPPDDAKEKTAEKEDSPKTTPAAKTNGFPPSKADSDLSKGNSGLQGQSALGKGSETEDLIQRQNAFISKVKLNLHKEPASMQGPIIALSLGLAFTVILLVFVACRLRTVRRRLRKGRPLHSNEADYLINGMYL